MTLIYNEPFNVVADTDLTLYLGTDWIAAPFEFTLRPSGWLDCTEDQVLCTAAYQGSSLETGGSYEVFLTTHDTSYYLVASLGPAVMVTGAGTLSFGGYTTSQNNGGYSLERWDNGVPSTLDYSDPIALYDNVLVTRLAAQVRDNDVYLLYGIETEQGVPYFPARIYMDSSAFRRTSGYPGLHAFTDVSENGESAAFYNFSVYSFSTVTYQYSYPIEDITVGSWSSTGVNLYSVVDDEEGYNDADYISTTTYDAQCELKLGSLPDPGVHNNHILEARVAVNIGSGPLTISLWQGSSTEIASTTYFYVTTQSVLLELSEAQAANITDYSDLRIRIRAGT